MSDADGTGSYHQLNVIIDSAKLNSTGGIFKPDPYVELSVDGKLPRKTEYMKSTYNPSWQERFTLLVTPYSKLQFKIYSHSALRRDVLLGQEVVDLYSKLKLHRGKFENLSMVLDLSSDGRTSSRSNVGELSIHLDGLKVDLNKFPSRPTREQQTANSSTNAAQANGSASQENDRSTGGISFTRNSYPLPYTPADSNNSHHQGVRPRVRPIPNGTAPGAPLAINSSPSSHSISTDRHSLPPVGNLHLAVPPPPNPRESLVLLNFKIVDLVK